jgi:hypothetical protein
MNGRIGGMSCRAESGSRRKDTEELRAVVRANRTGPAKSTIEKMRPGDEQGPKNHKWYFSAECVLKSDTSDEDQCQAYREQKEWSGPFVLPKIRWKQARQAHNQGDGDESPFRALICEHAESKQWQQPNDEGHHRAVHRTNT